VLLQPLEDAAGIAGDREFRERAVDQRQVWRNVSEVDVEHDPDVEVPQGAHRGVALRELGVSVAWVRPIRTALACANQPARRIRQRSRAMFKARSSLASTYTIKPSGAWALAKARRSP
jgi:hypothetical protein